MPKGKSKKNRGASQGSPAPQALNMAPQAVAHRRGGTHKVSDKDRTDSVYDTYNYKDLLDTAKERGIYRKDMKKVEMAWALKHNDEEKKRAEHDAMIAHHRKVHEQKKEEAKIEAERQKLIIAKHKRRVEKEKRREGDESVSDDTMSDAEMEAREVTKDEYKRENVGQVSDESWHSTSTESTTPSLDRLIEPDCKLRLFEWPYEAMPLAHDYVQRPRSFWVPELLPRQISHAPLKIVTTISKQKFFLPGLNYPAGVAPDFVPILEAEIRNAARNGHLTGVLRKAVLEKGTDWAQRTLIQGWNAKMYFNLGSRNETKDLASTYQRWTVENRRLLRVKGKGDGVSADRERRHLQRYKNKARKTAEVYESCQYRSLAMCYLPAYLDFGCDEEEEEQRTLENLIFIRFPGCDVPHYYFWVREGEWPNPTIRNNAWNPAEMDKPLHTLIHHSNDKPGLIHKYPQKSWKPPVKKWMRVKKTDVQLQALTPLSPTCNTLDTIDKIEHALHSNGLAAVLSHYRTKWLTGGKRLAWERFARDLPALYPSGQLPDVPPIERSEGARMAVKLAMIDGLDPDAETCLSPLRGDEGWTRDDDTLWDVVEVDAPTTFSPIARTSEHQYGDERFVEIGTFGEEEEEEEDEDEFEDIISRDVEEEALYRRGSLAFNVPHGKEDLLERWLEGVTPGDVPPEEMSGEGDEKVTTGECPFCEERWEYIETEEQAAHMLSYSTTKSRASRRSSTSQNLVVAIPPAARTSSYRSPRIRTNIPRLSIDLGAEGDVDTPRKPNFIQNPKGALRLKTKINPRPSLKKPAKRQRRRIPTDHPEAAYNPRKRSCSTIDSLEFLGTYGAGRLAKRRKMAMPKVGILPREPEENDESVSPVRLLMLERRSSKTDDPSYEPSKEGAKPKKRRKIEDPTYRDTLPSSESDNDDNEVNHPISESQQEPSNLYDGILPSPVLSDRKLPPLKTRKRKSVRDETCKGGAVIFASSEDKDATRSLPRPALKKRKKIIDPTYRDLSTLNLASSEESEVGVRPVRKVNRKMQKIRVAKKIVRFVEEPEIIPDFGRNLWVRQDRKRRAECLQMNDGDAVQDRGRWSWCAVM